VREGVLILDFGSQYTQLIARRVREQRVYCEIHPPETSPQEVGFSPRGVILSGGPRSVYDPDAPLPRPEVLELPLLGICYGMQAMAQVLGGRVRRGERQEYGQAELEVLDEDVILRGLGPTLPVWMSHGDRVEELPPGFQVLARSANAPIAAMGHASRPLYGVQFHPEVVHTPRGAEVFRNFLFGVCGCQPSWDMGSFLERTIQEVRHQVGSGKVICAVSGGVDSTVTAAIVHRAVGERLRCVFIDNGLLREGEAGWVVRTFRRMNIPLEAVNASERFLQRLRGVVDPEEKRRIVGEEFIRAFEEQAQRLGPTDFLAQGTLYPDVIESRSIRGPSAVIKSHHNVGGLPQRMSLRLVEPLRELFKDEVRQLGRLMGLSSEVLERQPFPGPGLAVRVVGEVPPQRLTVLRRADRIVEEELSEAGIYQRVWQSFAVLLPVRSVGVMGDQRTYEEVVVLRVVESRDGMTADWVEIPWGVLGRISRRIINEVSGVNRVVYDISSKPPSTIEWE